MTEQVIYDALENGSDNAAISGLICYVLLAGLFSYLALTFRSLRNQGGPLSSRSMRTTWVRTVLAKIALPLVTVMILTGIAFGLLVWKRYQADRELLASGAFQSISGVLADYRAAEVWRSGRKRITDDTPGFQPTLHERDRILIGDRTFLVACDKPPGTQAAAVGDEGKCLNLRPGQQIRVDFVQLTPTEYRAEPLRIIVIE